MNSTTRMPSDYRIPDDPDNNRLDAAYLRSCLGLRAKPEEEPPELPDAVRRAHYDMTRSLSILGAKGSTMTPTQLATVVALAMREGVVPHEEETEYSFPANSAEPGQKVVIRWRNKDRPAHFLQVRDGRIVVLHDGNERNVRPDLVRFAEDDEFPDVEENINAQASSTSP
jgi:hypothetical protein